MNEYRIPNGIETPPLINLALYQSLLYSYPHTVKLWTGEHSGVYTHTKLDTGDCNLWNVVLPGDSTTLLVYK